MRRTPLVEALLIILHMVQTNTYTKQALSARPPLGRNTANALHTPSTIQNQLAQLQDMPTQSQTPAAPQATASRHVHSQVRRTDPSSVAPTPLSRNGLQTAESVAAASTLKRQALQQRNLPAAQSNEQQALQSPNQTEYRNPVFGQVKLKTCPPHHNCINALAINVLHIATKVKHYRCCSCCTVQVPMQL